MSYNLDLPPRVMRTEQTAGDNPDEWELQTNSGNTITSYTTVGISVSDWWEDLLVYVKTNSATPIDAIEDITLLMIQKDWVIED